MSFDLWQGRLDSSNCSCPVLHDGSTSKTNYIRHHSSFWRFRSLIVYSLLGSPLTTTMNTWCGWILIDAHFSRPFIAVLTIISSCRLTTLFCTAQDNSLVWRWLVLCGILGQLLLLLPTKSCGEKLKKIINNY